MDENYLHPRWRDMSEWLVHFTDTAANLSSIVREQEVRASGPFGWGRTFDEVKEAHLSACLSEIPLDHISRLMDRHGHWGIGFSRRLIVEQGGARVWYLDARHGPAEGVFEKVGQLLREEDFSDPVWGLTPFIDSMADGEPFHYRFDHEREWRVPGGLDFDISDVEFLLTPEGTAERLDPDVQANLPVVLRSGQRSAFLKSVKTQLWDESDVSIDRFLQRFTDPGNVLSYDSAEGGYQWVVTEWNTEDAVHELFEETATTEELIDELNLLSPSWVDLDESIE